MERMELSIEGMSCGHCVRAVTGALGSLRGVEVDGVRPGSAQVRYDPAVVGPDAVRGAVEAAGYRVAGAEVVP